MSGSEWVGLCVVRAWVDVKQRVIAVQVFGQVDEIVCGLGICVASTLRGRMGLACALSLSRVVSVSPDVSSS